MNYRCVFFNGSGIVFSYNSALINHKTLLFLGIVLLKGRVVIISLTLVRIELTSDVAIVAAEIHADYAVLYCLLLLINTLRLLSIVQLFRFLLK